jgi:alkylated DNA repair dioxygenase AlkB
MFDTCMVAPPSPADLQGSLLASGEPGVPTDLGEVTRLELGQGAWIDWASDWLPGADAWFSRMVEELPWSAASRSMYERVIDVPRLICNFPSPNDRAIPLDLLRVRPIFEAAYERPFSRIGANLYRNGKDSVAMHADKVPFPGDTIVAIVAVGERRPFHVRHQHYGPLKTFSFGRGDLLVMGGTMQAFFHHGVPKMAGDNSRVSLMFRG